MIEKNWGEAMVNPMSRVIKMAHEMEKVVAVWLLEREESFEHNAHVV